MRLFVAIELPDSVKDQISGLAKGLAAQIPELQRACRWVKPEHFHITVKFIGECPDSMLAPWKLAMDETCRSHSPFTLSFQGIGTFNQGRSLKVLWLGTAEGTDAAKALAIGLQETPRYHPHLTLARSKGAIPMRSFDKALRGGVDILAGPFEVGALALIQSVLSPQGPAYSTLYRAPLNPGVPR